jgi:hypothetical protein
MPTFKLDPLVPVFGPCFAANLVGSNDFGVDWGSVWLPGPTAFDSRCELLAELPDAFPAPGGTAAGALPEARARDRDPAGQAHRRQMIYQKPRVPKEIRPPSYDRCCQGS